MKNTTNIDRLDLLNQEIVNTFPGISSKKFPIYIRYLREDNIFGLLYFNKKDNFILGIVSEKSYFDKVEDAGWMKYKEIKYCVNIQINDDFKSIINQIKKNL